MEMSKVSGKKGKRDRKGVSLALTELLMQAFRKDVQAFKLDLVERMFTEHEDTLTGEDKSRLAAGALGDEPIRPEEIDGLARPKLMKLLSSARDKMLRLSNRVELHG